MDGVFHSWLSRLEQIQSELLSAPTDRPDLILPLISSALAHFRDYYDAKSRLADDDVIFILSPSWLTPLEKTFVWVAGWKPSLAFRLLPPSDALSGHQAAEVERLRRETAAAEHRVSENMARAQEAMVGTAALAAARGGARNGTARAAAADAVLRAIRVVVGEADMLRVRTVTRLVALLTPAQAAEFIVQGLELRLRVRRWGLARDARAANQ